MDKTKKKAIYGLIGSVVLLLIIIGTSYAYIKYDTEEKSANVIGTDCISLEMEDVTDSIILQKAFPMTEDNEAIEPYAFKLTNNCSVGVNYQINLRVENEGIDEEKRMPVEGNIATKIDNKTKVILSSTNKVPKTETEEESKDEYKISTEDFTLAPKETVQHSVKIWLDEGAGNETQNKVFKSKIVVEAKQNQIVSNEPYKEELLNGAAPVLSDGLIAVEIDDKGTVTVADITDKWYNYGEKRWANAIIPTEDAKSEVQRLIAGEIIQEDQIESYFVWIPKYKYKLFNLEEYPERTEKEDKHNQAIEIVFGLDNTTDSEEKHECKTPMLQNRVQGSSGEKGNCEVGDYMTHPAFLAFGDVKGLWVGKFETGHSSGKVSSAIKEYSNDLQQELIIKPNKYSWTETNVSTMHQLAINYKPSLDSHMMKNTEWGAVAYLTQSIYGRCTKSGEGNTTCEEVMMNNNINYITGFAVVDPQNTSSNYEKVEPGKDGEKTINYKNTSSVKASTTGNYTGVYDMSGGSMEDVMAVMYEPGNDEPISGESAAWNSGFNGPYTNGSGSKTDGIDFPDDKYYDVYKYGTSTNDYTRRILGDATGEIGPFDSEGQGSYYADYGSSASSSLSWVRRGGSSTMETTRSGVFNFTARSGFYESNCSFRIVLAPLS